MALVGRACLQPSARGRMGPGWTMTKGLRPRVTGSPAASRRCSCPWNPNPSGLRGGWVWGKPRGGLLSLGSRLAFLSNEPGLDLGDNHPVGQGICMSHSWKAASQRRGRGMESEQDLSPPSKGSLSSGGNSSCEPCWVWGRGEGTLNLKGGVLETSWRWCQLN